MNQRLTSTSEDCGDPKMNDEQRIYRSDDGKIVIAEQRITIVKGIDENGDDAITTTFEDLTSRDESGNPHLTPYFPGLTMLGVANNEFFTKHMLEEE